MLSENCHLASCYIGLHLPYDITLEHEIPVGPDIICIGHRTAMYHMYPVCLIDSHERHPTRVTRIRDSTVRSPHFKVTPNPQPSILIVHSQSWRLFTCQLSLKLVPLMVPCHPQGAAKSMSLFRSLLLTSWALSFCIVAATTAQPKEWTGEHDVSLDCKNPNTAAPASPASPASSSSSSSSYRWIPQAQHPCTVERISHREFQRRFGPRGLPPLFPTPLVIVSDQDQDQNQDQTGDSQNSTRRNQKFRELTRVDAFLNVFGPDFNITLSSSNSYSEHRRTVAFQDYLKELLFQSDTLPDQRSNETWYFFGETYSSEWKTLLQHYDIPNCHACQDRTMVALAFGIGNRGSGVQWHVHGPGFAETIWGRKHWVLMNDKPDFHPDQTSRNWMEYTYTNMTAEQRPLECTLAPGDILYFPDRWYHATINLDPYTAFVSSFTQEHLFVESW